jgi:predicted deacylase
MKLKTHTVIGIHDGPHLLITGGVHGDESAPMAAIRQLACDIQPAVLRGRVTLVPVVNEPAFVRGSRTAEDGLDLARVCPGRPDGSLTERIADALSELIRAADYYIDLHTGGMAMEILPLVGYMLHPDPRVLDVQRRMAQAFHLPLVWGTDWRLDGRSLSVARDARVPAIYAEYGGGVACDRSCVSAYAAGCQDVMSMLGMMDPSSHPRATQTLVEDDRPNSGYLQIAHPAPLAGLFEPMVTLGQHVGAGDVLGTVAPLPELAGERVVSLQHGVVVALATMRRVLKGEGLAVILEKPITPGGVLEE